MTVTIDLGPEMEQELRTEAAKEGLDPSGLVVSVVREHLNRARHPVPHLSKNEADLLETISYHWSRERQSRFDYLVSKRRAHKITRGELAELISLTDESEHRAAERVRAVTELAKLRGCSFEDMWRQLETNG